jgi:polyisoprenoid-binding protein YceI
MYRQLFLILLTAGLVYSGEYHVDKDKNNLVKFISDAPIEDFEGVTDQIDGYVYWENSDYTKNSEIYVEVDLNTLDTGIGLRNRHMRENYLETDQYPVTYFRGKIVSNRVVNDSTVSIDAQGEIFIHGITQPLTVKADLIEKTGGYRIRTNFIVKLSDFQIEIPSIMFYKIDENMDLQLDFFVKEIKD